MSSEKISKFIKSYFALREKYIEENNHNSLWCNADIYMAIFDDQVTKEILPNNWPDFHNRIKVYIMRYLNGDIKNQEFDINVLSNLSIYPVEIINYLDNCIEYYLHPHTQLPADFNGNSRVHRTFAFIKCMTVFARIFNAPIDYKHFMIMSEIAKKYNILEKTKLSADFISKFQCNICAPDNQNELLVVVEECEKLYKIYCELSESNIKANNVINLKKICKRYNIPHKSNDRRAVLEAHIRNSRNF